MNTQVRGVLLLGCVATLTFACASEEGAQEPTVPELAGTQFPAPRTDAEKVNWATGGLPNDHENPQSDFRRAQHLMAQLADAAYGSDSSFRSTAESHGFNVMWTVHSETGVIGQTDADALMGQSVDSKMNYVAIRGSQQLSDFALDAFVVPTAPWNDSGAPTTLHQGIAQYADAVYQGMRTAIGSSCEGDELGVRKPLWITGHSLGGAAATVLAYRLAQEGCYVAGVSTFGSMRAGQSDWQEAYNQTMTNGLLPLAYVTQRWVRKNDPFYCLPIGGAWKHVGLEDRFDEHGMEIASHAADSCADPNTPIGALKTALTIADLPVNLAVGVQRAISDWLTDLIQLLLFCQPGTNWDDVWSLGACTVTASTDRFIQTYGVTPTELTGIIINLAGAAKDHDNNLYARDLSADFSEPVDTRPKVKIRTIIDAPEFYASATLYEPNSGAFCTPDRMKDGRLYCDFPLRVGAPVRLEWGEYNKYWGYLAGNCPHPLTNTGVPNDEVCEFVAGEPMEIVFKVVPTLF